jgi:hypothetical protein
MGELNPPNSRDMIINNWIKYYFPLGCLILSACAGTISPDSGADTATPEPAPAPWEPSAGDDDQVRGEVFLESADIVELEGGRPGFGLRISGALPTPCHELRVVIAKPDDTNTIQVEIYSLIDPDEICIQVLEPLEATIPLGDYPSGAYQVVTNGVEIGKINP